MAQSLRPIVLTERSTMFALPEQEMDMREG